MKPGLVPPTLARERKAPAPKGQRCIRFGKELADWISKAAYQEGHDFSSFVRMATRKEADRVLGYNRAGHRSRRT